MGAQISTTPRAEETSTPTPSPTTTGTPATPTRTATATVSATATATGTATPSVTPSLTPTIGTQTAKNPLLESLAVVGTRAAAETPRAVAPGAVAAGGADATWLGGAFADDADTVADEQHNPQDSDGDGYSDVLERRQGSEVTDARSTPAVKLSTSLAARLQARGTTVAAVRARIEADRGSTAAPGTDIDGDGIPNDLEVQIGSSVRHSDTDGDGILDGREVQLGSDPVAAE